MLRAALFTSVSTLCGLSLPSQAATTPSANPYAVNPYAPAAASTYANEGSDRIEDLLNLDERKLIQESLVWFGVYNGWIDGSFGKGTRDAIAVIQRKFNQPATGQLDADLAVHLGGSALNTREKAGWKTIRDPKTGITLGYPSKVLTVITSPKDTNMVDLDSADKRISLELVVVPGAEPRRIDTLYEDLNNDSQSHVTYKFRKGDLFITAGDRGNNKYYSRYEQRGDQIRGFDLVWNNDLDSDMQPMAVLISNSFEPFDIPRPNLEPNYSTLSALAQAAKRQSEGTAAQGNGGGQNGQRPAPAQQTAQQPTQMPTRQAQRDAQDANDPSEGKGTRFSYTYQAPRSAKLEDAYRFTRDADLLVGNLEIDAMDGLFVMPRTLHYVGTECGAVNAFYSPKDSAIYLCYELVDYLLHQADKLNTNHDPMFLAEYVKYNLRFILLHETGHAFIDLLDLPATGREEDAVDQMAASMILLHFSDSETAEQLTRVLSMTALWFKTNASLENGTPDNSAFSDEHSLNEQRYYNLLCMIYGRDPQYYSSIVENGLLPKNRAARCPQEASKIITSWSRLLLPHFAPRYQKVRDETIQRLNERDAAARAQQGGA
jgi:peptidoglycan hydrolase-like protein with peptidoglycan-binding domain